MQQPTQTPQYAFDVPQTQPMQMPPMQQGNVPMPPPPYRPGLLPPLMVHPPPMGVPPGMHPQAIRPPMMAPLVFAPPTVAAVPPPAATQQQPKGGNASGDAPAPAEKVTTVFVGHICEGVSDDVMKQLLMECGKVLKWSRSLNPTTKKLTTFGFCEFDSSQGVYRAHKILNGLELGDNLLVVNCQEKTLEAMERWHSHDRIAAARAQRPDLPVQDILRDLDLEHHRSEQNIRRIAAEATSRQRKKREEAEPEEPTADGETKDKTQAERKSDRHAAATQPTQNSTTSPFLEASVTAVLSKVTADLALSGNAGNERIPSREKDRLQRFVVKLREREREYWNRLREWERAEETHEAQRTKLKEREHQRLFSTETGLKRLVSDAVKDDSEPPSKRRREELRRVLAKEREDDSLDRSREAAEEAALQAAQAAKEEEEAAREAAAEAAALEAQPSELTAQRHRFRLSGKGEEPECEKKPVALGADSGDVAHAVKNLFGSADEVDDLSLATRKHRPLAKLDRVLDRSNLEQQADYARRHKALLQKITPHVPTEKDELFGTPVDWDLLTKNDIFQLKLRPWICKKVVDFLGVEEQEMINFLMEKVTSRPSPADLLEQLTDFLDEEAEGFVSRLWKVLIFEQLRLQNLHLLYPQV